MADEMTPDQKKKAIAEAEARRKAEEDAAKDKPKGSPPADHAKALEDAIAAEESARPEVDRASYGVFADHPQKFVVEAEMVGKHRRGEEISYRELMVWHGGDRSRPNASATKANADRLVAAGHIRPLADLGG